MENKHQENKILKDVLFIHITFKEMLWIFLNICKCDNITLR